MSFLTTKWKRGSREAQKKSSDAGYSNESVESEHALPHRNRTFNEVPTELFTKLYYFGFADTSEVALSIREKGQYAVSGDDSKEKIEFILSFGQVVEGTLQVFHVSIYHVGEEPTAPRAGPPSKMFGRKSGWKVEKNSYLETDKTFQAINDVIEHFVMYRKLGLPANRPDFLIRDRDIRIKKQIGEGHFCVVSKGSYTHGTRDTYTECAIKEFKETDVSKSERQKEIIEMRREASTMRIMKHPNIIMFYGVAADTPNIKLIMELCTGGALLNFLQTYKDNIDNREKVQFGFEVSRGMRYVESVGVIHRDLAARNCLIGRNGMIKPSTERADFDVTCRFFHGLIRDVYRPPPPVSRCVAKLPHVFVKDRDDNSIDIQHGQKKINSVKKNVISGSETRTARTARNQSLVVSRAKSVAEGSRSTAPSRVAARRRTLRKKSASDDRKTRNAKSNKD
uniref:Protein kinase domain-containing protein n=1 Tax=Bursaphelenchus xylophilus TaxID=6326 RepID=A0A1I7SCC1_BURXY